MIAPNRRRPPTWLGALASLWVIAGAIIGITFHVLNKTAGHLGMVYGLSAALSAT